MRIFLLDPFNYFSCIRNRPERENARRLDTGQRRPDRFRTRRQDQGIIDLPIDLSGFKILDFNLFLFGIDAAHIAVGSNFDVEALPEKLGRCHQQIRFIGDHVTDIIGESAVCKRDIRSPVKNDNFRLL